MLITCSTTFAGESGPRAWSESVVEGVVHAAQSQMRKVKDTEIYAGLIFIINGVSLSIQYMGIYRRERG